jgi:hypothetical protein
MPNPLTRWLGQPDRATQLQVMDQLNAAAATFPATVGPASPAAFHPDANTLNAVVWADLVGGDGILTRAAAIAIPALARQRHLLCGTIARCPLVQLGPGERLPALDDTAAWTELYTRQPVWMQRSDGDVSPYHRMLWTVDDLLFHGWSLWRATRGFGGTLLDAERIPAERWEVDPADRVLIDGELVRDQSEVIIIPGPHEGILNFGAGALRRTIANLDAAANAARNPSAYLELHYTGDADLTPEQIDTHIGRWAAARRGENGGVAWTNKVLELKEHGTHESHLLIEGRNADAVDVSRLVSSPASMADATNAGASLTYETTEGRNGEFIDYGVSLYMDAIAARLSMDDVVARGQRSRFDTTELRATSPSATGTPTTD